MDCTDEISKYTLDPEWIAPTKSLKAKAFSLAFSQLCFRGIFVYLYNSFVM